MIFGLLGAFPLQSQVLSGGSGWQNYFHMLMQFLLFHWAASPANAAKGTVGKTAVLRLNQGLAVAPNIQSHWIHHWHTQWKKSQFYVGLSLMKQLKMTEILTHEYISFIWCDEMDVHVTGFSCLCPHLICCNMLLWLKCKKKLWLCTNA